MADRTANSTVARRRSRWVAAQKQSIRGALQPRRVLWTLWRVGVPIVIMGIWLIALLLRAFVQDRIEGLPTYLFYATPPLVLALMALAAGVWLIVVGHRTSALPVLTLGVACLPWAYQSAWVSGPKSPATLGNQPLRVMYWNVAWGFAGWDTLVEAIQAQNADIIVLGEARREVHGQGKEFLSVARQASARSEIYLTREFPDYDVIVSWAGIAMLVRGEILEHDSVWLRAGQCLRCAVEIRGRRLHVCGIDVIVTPGPRRVPLGRICDALDELGDAPILAIGDFNTPTDSFYLHRLRKDYRNAFEVAGSGYAATWPWPVPLLTIDHAWVNRHLVVANCELSGTWLSDHRMITFDMAFSSPSPATQPVTANAGP